MLRSRLVLLMASGLLCITCSAAVTAAEWFVAPDGKDENPGTKDKPFLTIARARDEVRQHKAANGPNTVWLRGGTYLLPKTLRFSGEDSGTEAAPIIYRAFEKEKPVLIGGQAVKDWKPYKDRILQADLAGQGLKGVNFKQLIFNGRRQVLARYPNFDPANPYGGGWAYVDGKLLPMYQEDKSDSKRAVHYKASDARTWARPDEVEVFIFPRYNWWNNIVRVQTVDQEQRIAHLTADCSYAVRPGDRYYFQNALEELDAPGEWYLDTKSGTVYFWPPEPIDQHSVFVPTTPTVISLSKTQYVTLRGLTIECSERDAVELADTQHCLVAGCTIRNVGHYGGTGVSVHGGSSSGVVGCDIFNTGRSGIFLGGGDRKTLTPAKHYADNNYIHHIGVYYKQGVGVELTGVGNRALHNLIHDGPRMGIMFSGNNLLIEQNHIRHVNLETEDTGAVYTGGRDWISSRGTVIRDNYFHDILGYGHDAQGNWVSPHFAWGVYLDDNTGGVDVIGNVLVRCSRAGLHLHNGRDNVIENNFLIDNGQQQFEFNGWRPTDHFWAEHFKTMVAGYESVAGQPAWQQMRHMELHPKDAVLPDGTVMAGNVFQKNVVAYSTESKLLSMRNVSFAHNQFDHNLYFHFGQPLKTGYHAAGKEISENLVPNGDFEQGPVDQMPAEWHWQIHSLPTAKAVVVTTDPAQGKQALRLDAAFNTEKARDNYPIVVNRDQELKLGGSYRLRAKLRATNPNATAKVMVQSYVANAYFWADNHTDIKVGQNWTPVDVTFRIPAPGEKGHHEKMKLFRVRVDFPDKAGSLFVDDVQLHEVEPLSEFAAWQKQGNDVHSLVADPQFENVAREDYRLKVDSPAKKLGIRPPNIGDVGPYRDDLRASWPIVEAEGAREKPLTLRPK